MNADKTKTRTSEPTVLRLLLDSSPAPKLLFLFWSGCDIPDEILQLLSRAEDCHTMALNRDNLSSLRIASLLASLAGSDFEGAETSELNDLVLLESVLDLLEQLINDLMNVAAGDSQLVVEGRLTSWVSGSFSPVL